MINNSYTLTIPKGCRIQEETILVDFDTAFDDILDTEEQLRYTNFELLQNSDKIKFTKHFIVCSNCGQPTPAYTHFIEGSTATKKFSGASARTWSENAMSLFGIPEKKVPLYRPITESNNFTCMYCGSEPRYTNKEAFITISFYRDKLTITYPLTDIADILDVNWAMQTINVSNFPLSESVTFNFKRGSTYIQLKTFSKKTLAIMDISGGIADLKRFTSPLINLISDNIVIKSHLYKLFEAFWEKKLPFKENEIDIHNLVLLNAFVGYDDKTFYSYIPRANRSLNFDKSYKSTRNKMRYANNLVDVYDKSSLPNMKSIRTIMFENPKFFFFIKELEKLWVASHKNPDFFCDFLKDINSCSNLSFLHDHPLAFELYEELCKEKNLRNQFRDALFHSPQNVNEYAITYATLSNIKKAAAKKRLMTTACRFIKYSNNMEQYFYSLPESGAISSIQDQEINGFTFATLKTFNDYAIAGEQLNNCLGTEEFDTPVIGIKRGSKYLAAFQVDVDGKYVIQAYLESNRKLNKNPIIFTAFKEWCNNNSYEFDEEDIYVY